MGAKLVPLIEKKRIVDEIITLKKKMTMLKACESAGVSVHSYWNYRKCLNRSGMMEALASKEEILKTSPTIDKEGTGPMIKIYLQDATFILSAGSFEVKNGHMEFEGKGTIEIDNK